MPDAEEAEALDGLATKKPTIHTANADNGPYRAKTTKTENTHMAKAKTPKPKLNVSALLASASITVPADLSEAQAVAGEYSQTKLEHDTLVVKRDDEIKAVQAKYAKSIEERVGIMDRCRRRLEAFFTNRDNRERFLKGMQSTIVNRVKCFFQVSPGKVETLPGKKEDDVVNAILATGDQDDINRWLALKPRLDKEAILKDWACPEDRALLESLGIVVVKPESFDICDLDRTDIIN